MFTKYRPVSYNMGRYIKPLTAGLFPRSMYPQVKYAARAAANKTDVFYAFCKLSTFNNCV